MVGSDMVECLRLNGLCLCEFRGRCAILEADVAHVADFFDLACPDQIDVFALEIFVLVEPILLPRRDLVARGRYAYLERSVLDIDVLEVGELGLSHIASAQPSAFEVIVLEQFEPGIVDVGYVR